MKIRDCIALMIMVFLFGIVALVGYWLLYPYKPVTINRTPALVVNKEVDRGGHLHYLIDFCKNSNITPIVSRTFVDGLVYTPAPYPAPKNEIGCQVLKVAVYVPKALPSGEYVLETTYTYQVNPIRHVEVTYSTEPFMVK